MKSTKTLSNPWASFEDLDVSNLPRKQINIHGREEHESILRDRKRISELNLDPIYEKMVYLRRWGSWINGCVDYTGKI